MKPMNERATIALATITKIQHLIDVARYPEADKQLQGIDISDLTYSDKGEVLLLRIRVNIALGVYDHAVVKDALKHYSYKKRAAGFAKTKLLFGCMLSKEGKFDESRQVLNEAAATFIGIGDKQQAAGAHNQIANDALSLGKFRLAQEKYSSAYDLFYEAGDTTRALDVVHNLAYLFREQGLISAAYERFEYYRQECSPGKIRKDVEYNNNVADVLVAMGKTSEARDRLIDARKSIGGSRRSEVVNLCVEGKSYLMEAKPTEAIRPLKASLIIAEEIGSDLRSSVGRVLAECLFMVGETMSADRTVKVALRLATNSNEWTEIAACHRVQGQIDIKAGRKTDALQHFETALDIFTKIDSRYELAITVLIVAGSKVLIGSENDKLVSQAVSYFESEQLPIPRSKLAILNALDLCD